MVTDLLTKFPVLYPCSMEQWGDGGLGRKTDSFNAWTSPANLGQELTSWHSRDFKNFYCKATEVSELSRLLWHHIFRTGSIAMTLEHHDVLKDCPPHERSYELPATNSQLYLCFIPKKCNHYHWCRRHVLTSVGLNESGTHYTKTNAFVERFLTWILHLDFIFLVPSLIFSTVCTPCCQLLPALLNSQLNKRQVWSNYPHRDNKFILQMKVDELL